MNTRDGETLEVVPLSEFDDEHLLEMMARYKLESEIATRRLGTIEMEVQRRIRENGGTTLFGREQNYVMETKPEYDRTKLSPLLELFDQEGRAKSFIPAHTETVDVPDKWDLTQAKKYARARGKEALAIIENATFPGRATGKLVDTN